MDNIRRLTASSMLDLRGRQVVVLWSNDASAVAVSQPMWWMVFTAVVISTEIFLKSIASRILKTNLHLLALALIDLQPRQKHQVTTELLPHGFQDKSSKSRSHFIHSKEIEVLFDVYSVLTMQKKWISCSVLLKVIFCIGRIEYTSNKTSVSFEL